MSVSEANKILAEARYRFDGNCEADLYAGDCLDLIGKIVYTSIVADQWLVTERYTKYVASGSSSEDISYGECSEYIFNDKRKSASFHVSRYSAISYVGERNGNVSKKAIIYAALCYDLQAFGRDLNRPLPKKDYPGNADNLSEVMFRFYGKDDEDVLNSFHNRIMNPYVEAALALAHQYIQTDFPKYAALSLELSKNAIKAANGKYPKVYIDFLKEVERSNRYILGIGTEAKNVKP